MDKNENLGAKLVKEAASKTSKIAGDGTTTATVLTEALFKEAFKNLAAGADVEGGLEDRTRAPAALWGFGSIRDVLPASAIVLLV